MICVDASTALKWLFPEEHSGQATALREDCRRIGEQMIAPPICPEEVTNSLFQRRSGLPLGLAESLALLDQFLDVPLVIVLPEGMYHEALRIAARHQLPAIYDAYYVACAVLHACPLWTADRRLLRALGGLPFANWIGDYAGNPLP